MINVNGNIVPASQAYLSPTNRGFTYGDSVFETLRLTSGKILFWEDHYFRLMASMRILRMEIPMNFTMEFLMEQVLETAKQAFPKENSIKVRINVYRNEGGLYSPEDNTVSFVITAQKLDADFYLHNSVNYEVELFKDYYMNSGLLSTIKTNNKVLHVLAGIFAKENGYNNCLLLNENKMVVEALNGNLFLVSGKTIKTPPITDGCLRGIIRKQLIKIILQMPDYAIEESSISPFELQKAEELFITNVVTGIQSITKYRKKEFNTDVAKELTTKLNIKIRLG
ncbi:MAG: aminotransferase class IV [Flavobacteriaceae bacterium CG_4_8_14_3_um_filter_34_10]|nr:MAG: aminotransferase class IV [Flavobacteriaceae bacterium CG2_30_34_30]PIQ18633.1 MAG: aminotransferase class IV [Flavobacteriaceae bacterium CG18_big_fil_WC_8_21_14_2_50_34_36]PIV49618.1 MAG: aminotransferase class IV [Flavobacteriaceae bacterium CG02_land_8_20_14_3_00_34_13]PIX09875.1 MAG: aminotransferase class IV [Flavobacteriaceae bacterium CG_4_8_14_3_um_filter_34_10]PIZ07649.1 MAG: aminotransferase class IV [Flavobacteriaceae bacterium CG_4_10_14_0_8_um_filter_34_31]PJC07588.1 MAG: